MAAVSTLWGISAFAGPLVGGFFVEYATWRWGFAFFACQAFALALWIVLPERFDRLIIVLGMTVVTLSILGFLHAVPNGPVWLIAVSAAMEGGGFGMAWSFILRRTIAVADADEVQRVFGAIPTIQRLGYALGAAYVRIVANASGLLSMETPADAAKVARWVFVSCVPFAAIGLIAMSALIRDRKGKLRPRSK